MQRGPHPCVKHHIGSLLYLWPLGLFSLQDAVTAMSLEYSPRPSLALPPCSLFNRRGAVHYFPRFGPNLRHYLPLTSLKNSVWFALSTGGGDHGHHVNSWVAVSGQECCRHIVGLSHLSMCFKFSDSHIEITVPKFLSRDSPGNCGYRQVFITHFFAWNTEGEIPDDCLWLNLHKISALCLGHWVQYP